MLRRALVAMLLMLPAPAHGDELRLGLATSVEYDSNVFRQQRNETDDVIFRFGPELTLTGQHAEFDYRLRYVSPFEQGVDTGEDVSDFDQIVQWLSNYRVGEATSVFANNRFRYDRGLTQRFATGSDVPGVSNERNRILNNRAEVGVNHAFTPRLAGGWSASHNLFTSSQRFRQDNQTFGTTLDLNYAAHPRHTVGGGFSFTAQGFDESGNLSESQTLFYNLFATWVFRIDETTSFSVSGGPTLIQQRQDAPQASVRIASQTPSQQLDADNVGVIDFANCTGTVGGQPVLRGCGAATVAVPNALFEALLPTGPVDPAFAPGANPGSSDDLEVTAFGTASLTRRWTRDISSSISYRRQQSNASGLGGSTILDAVTIRADWNIDQWWEVGVRGDFTRRESVNQLTENFLVVVPGPGNVATLVDGPGGLVSRRVTNAIDTNRWGATARIERAIGRNAEATLRFNYSKQNSKRGTRGNASDFDVYLAVFAVRYRFDPIDVW